MFVPQAGIWSQVRGKVRHFAALMAVAVCAMPALSAAAIDAHEAAALTDGPVTRGFGTVFPWATPRPIVDANALDTTRAKNVRMATDFNGNWVAAYHTGDPKDDGTTPAVGVYSKLRVSHSTNDGGSWSQPITLPPVPGAETDYNFRPELDFGNTGTQEYVMAFEALTLTGPHIYVTPSADGGINWDPATQLDITVLTDNNNPRKVSIASDHFGSYMAAWIANADGSGPPGLNIAFSPDNGVTWLLKRRIPNTGDGRPQVKCNKPDVDTAALWAITFEQVTQAGTDLNPMFTDSEDNGDTWATEEINTDAASESTNDYVPRMDFEVDFGTWSTVWASDGSANGLYNLWSASAFQDVFNTTDGGFVWDDPVLIASDVNFGARQTIDPWISTDDFGDWITIWSAITSQAPQKRGLFAAMSTDDAFTFGSPDLVNDFPSSNTRWLNPVLQSNLAGRWLAMWQNLAGSPQTAASPQTAVPWYSTTFVALDDQYADVSIQATDVNGGQPLYAGVTPGTFFPVTYTVTNNGPQPVFNVDISINAQVPVTAYNFQDTGTGQFQQTTVAFPVVGVPFQGTYPQLDPGQSETFILTYGSDTPGLYKLTADAVPHDSLGDPMIDPDQSNNINVTTLLDIQTGGHIVDLRITKTSFPSPVIVGDYLGYTIEVTNLALDSSRNVVITDPIPDHLYFVYANASQGDWTATTSGSLTTVVANIGTISPGARATLTMGLIPLAGSPALITNTACVDTSDIDINAGNNCGSVNTVVNSSGGTGADLSVVKTANLDPATQGTSFTYTLTAVNSGPNVATAVTINDTLPASLAFNGEFHTQGTVSRVGQAITANLGTMASGATAKVNISVIPTGTGAISNTAFISSATSDPFSNNNSSTNQVTVNAANPATVANLSITKTANPSPGTVGSPLTYTVQVSNAGPSAASNVRIQDVLPPQVSFVSSNPTESSYANGVVTYGMSTLASGAFQVFQISTNAIAGGTAINTASVSSDNPDLTPANNTFSLSTIINGGTGLPTNADLAISSSVAPTSTTVGNAITWTLTAHNNGPQSAANIVVHTTLPGNVTFVSATGPNGSASPVAGVLNVPITVLGSGASANVVITLVPQSGGNLTLTGTISGNVVDAVAANNTATSIVSVTGSSVFDLQGTWIKFKKKSKQGTIPSWSIKGTISVKNLRPTLLVAAPIQFYLSDDAVFSQNTDTLIGANTLKKIKPGKSKKKSVGAKFTFDPGGKYVIAVINPTGGTENAVPILIPLN